MAGIGVLPFIALEGEIEEPHAHERGAGEDGDEGKGGGMGSHGREITMLSVHPAVEELRPKLKEILYDCAVEIRATKAALYLYDANGRFELAGEYGFRGTARESIDTNHPVVDRCGRGRTPFYINGVGAEPRFSEVLYEASTDRLLAAPLYSRGHLVGLIDMRDKAGKQAFDAADLPKAQQIAERLVALFGNQNVFGQRFITLSDVHEAVQPASRQPPAPVPPPAEAEAKPAPPEPPQREERRAFVPRVATLILEARTAAQRLLIPPAPEMLTAADFAAAREALRAILLIPGANVAMLSAFGASGGMQEIVARASMTEEATNFLQSKLSIWLTKRGEAAGFARSEFHTPFGTSAPPVTPAQMQKVFTAPVVIPVRAVYLTVAFGAVPDRAAHEMLAAQLPYLQLVIEQSMQRGEAGDLRARVAAKLLEPDFTSYPELRRHTDLVVARVEAFARHLALPQPEAEAARLVAIVHDAGMRLLEYDRLYRKADLAPEEMGILREHPVVGAALVEPLLGAEVARAVLCHHERVDGRGYPGQMRGDEIPLLSRIVQICDAWVAMTDAETYRRPVAPPERALASLAQGAGSQFDAGLVSRFTELLRDGR